MSDYHATRWPGTPHPGFTAPASAYVTAFSAAALPLYGTDPGPQPYNPLNFGIGGQHDVMLQLGAQYILPQLMGGKLPTQFNPNQNMYDQLLSRHHSQSLEQAGAIAGEQDKSQIEQLMNGINRLAAGRELNERERMRNARFAGHATSAMPMLTAMLGPDMVDQLHGSSGSSMLLSQYVQAAGRGQIDPVTGQRGYSGQTSGMVSQEMFEQLFGPNVNKSAMYGLSAGRAGILTQELQNRGMLGPTMSGMPWSDRIGKMGTEYRSVMSDMARERDLGNVGNLPQMQTRLREMQGQLLDAGAVSRIAMRLPEIQQLKQAGTLTEPIMEAARAKVRQSHRTLLSSPDQVKDLRDLENLPGGEDIMRAGEADRYKARIKNLSGVVKAMRDVFGDRGNPNAPIGQLMAELDKLTQGSLAVMSAGQVENMVRKSRAIARSTGVSTETQGLLAASLTPMTDQLGLHRSFAVTSAAGGIMIGQAVADTQRLDKSAWGALTKDKAAVLGGQLQAASAASPLMNTLGAAIRMQEKGLVDADDIAQAPRNETQALLRAVRAGETSYEWDGQRRSIRKQQGTVKEMLQRDEGVNQATAYSIFADTTGTQEFIQQQGLVEKIGLATQQEEARQVAGGYLGTALRSQINMDPERNLNQLREAGVVQNQSDLTRLTIAVGQAVGQDLFSMDAGVRTDPGLRQQALAAAYKQRIQEQIKQRMPGADEATVSAVSDNLLSRLGGEQGMATLAETGWADFNRRMSTTPLGSGEAVIQLFSPETQRAKRRHEREQEAAIIMEKSLDPLATVGPIARLVDAMKAAGPGTKLEDILGTVFGVELDEIKKRDPEGSMAVALGLIEDNARLDIHKPADFKIYQRNAKIIRGILEGGEAATSVLKDLRAEQERDAPEPPAQLLKTELDVSTDLVLSASSRETERTARRQQDRVRAAADVVQLTEAGAAPGQTQAQKEEKWDQARAIIATEVAKSGGLTIDGWEFTAGDRIQRTVDGNTETQSLADPATAEAGLKLAGQLLTTQAAADAPQQRLPQILAERAARGSQLVRNVDEAWVLAKKPEALDTKERVDQAIQVLERLPSESLLRVSLLDDAKKASASWDAMGTEAQREFATKAQTVLQQQLTDKTGATREAGTAGGSRLTASGLIQADSAESRRQMAVIDKSIGAYVTGRGDTKGELKGIFDGRGYRITGTHIITGDTEESLGTANGREMAMVRIQEHARQQQERVDQHQTQQKQRVTELQEAYGRPATPPPYETSAEEAQLAQAVSQSTGDTGQVTEAGALEKLIQTLKGQDSNEALKQILKVLQESLGVLKDTGSTDENKQEAYQRVNAKIQAEQQRVAAASVLAQKPPEAKLPEQLVKHRKTIQDYIANTGSPSVKNAANDELTALGVRTKDGKFFDINSDEGQRRAAQITQEHEAAATWQSGAAATKELEAQEKILDSRNPTLLELRRLDADYNKPSKGSQRSPIANKMAWQIERHLETQVASREILSDDNLTKLTKDGLLTRETKKAAWQTQALGGDTPEAMAARTKATQLIEHDLVRQRSDGRKTRNELRSTIAAREELTSGATLMRKLEIADADKDQAHKDAGVRTALIQYINAQDGKQLTIAGGETVTAATLTADVTTLVGEKGQLTGDGLQLKGEGSAAKITDEAQLTTAIEILKSQEGQPAANPKLLSDLTDVMDNLGDTELTAEKRQQFFKQAQGHLQTSLGSPSIQKRVRADGERRTLEHAAAYAATQVAAGEGTWATGGYAVDKDKISKPGKPGKDGKPAEPDEVIKRDSVEGHKLLLKLSQEDAAARTKDRHPDGTARAIAVLEKAQPGFEGFNIPIIAYEAARADAAKVTEAVKQLADPKTDPATAAVAREVTQAFSGRTVSVAAITAAKILAGDGKGGLSKDLVQLGQGGPRLLQTIQDKDQELQKLAEKASEKLGRNVTVADLLAGVKMDTGDARQTEADAFSKQARDAFAPLEQAYSEVAARREAAEKLPAGAVPGKGDDARAPMSAFEIEAAKASQEFATRKAFAADKNAKLDVDGDGISSTAEKQAHDVYGRLVGVLADPHARKAAEEPARRKEWLQKLSRDGGALAFDRAIRSRGQLVDLAGRATFGDKKLTEEQRKESRRIADSWLQGDEEVPNNLDKAQQAELEGLRNDAKLLRGFSDVQADGLDTTTKQAFDDAGLAGDQMGASQDKKLAVTITGGNITLQEDGRLKVDLSGTSISNGATNKLGINVPTVV